MKVFQIVVDNGQDFERIHRLAPHVRAVKDTRPAGVTYLKVTDVTEQYPIDADYLEHTLTAAGYGDTERRIIIDSVNRYEGSTGYIAPEKPSRADKQTDTSDEQPHATAV